MLILLPYLFSPPGDENQSVTTMDHSVRSSSPPAFRHSSSNATAPTYLTHPNVSLSSSSGESVSLGNSISESADDEDDAWPNHPEDVNAMFLHGIQWQTMTYESHGLQMQMTWDEEEEEARGAVLRSSSLVREPFRDISNRTSPRNIIFRAH
jgi:hypothetical protein